MSIEIDTSFPGETIPVVGMPFAHIIIIMRSSTVKPKVNRRDKRYLPFLIFLQLLDFNFDQLVLQM